MSHRRPAGSLDLARATPWPGAATARTWRTHPEGAFPPHLVLSVTLLAVAVTGVLVDALADGVAVRIAGGVVALLGSVGMLAQRHVRRTAHLRRWAGFERDFRAYVAQLELPSR